LTTALAFGFPAIAADLPQSGSFKLHSGWKGVGEVVQVGDNHVFGTGNFWGVTLGAGFGRRFDRIANIDLALAKAA
jgi:hypothetical protein